MLLLLSTSWGGAGQDSLWEEEDGGPAGSTEVVVLAASPKVGKLAAASGVGDLAMAGGVRDLAVAGSAGCGDEAARDMMPADPHTAEGGGGGGTGNCAFSADESEGVEETTAQVMSFVDSEGSAAAAAACACDVKAGGGPWQVLREVVPVQLKQEA